MKDENAPKTPWPTYLMAAGWLILMPLSMATFRKALVEFYGKQQWLPFAHRLVVRTPTGVWIALGLLIGGGLIWKSRVLAPKTSERIDTVFVIIFGLFVAFFVFATCFQPLVEVYGWRAD